jgi:flagellar basal body-associated protein FliL
MAQPSDQPSTDSPSTANTSAPTAEELDAAVGLEVSEEAIAAELRREIEQLREEIRKLLVSSVEYKQCDFWWTSKK